MQPKETRKRKVRKRSGVKTEKPRIHTSRVSEGNGKENGEEAKIVVQLGHKFA